MTAGQLCLQPWPGNPKDNNMVCVLPHNHPNPWHQAGYNTTPWQNNQPTLNAMAQAFTQATT